jgi:hypothetical protein
LGDENTSFILYRRWAHAANGCRRIAEKQSFSPSEGTMASAMTLQAQHPPPRAGNGHRAAPAAGPSPARRRTGAWRRTGASPELTASSVGLGERRGR